MRRAFVAGHPIGHSRSPLIHGHWLRLHGVEGSYEAVDIAPGGLASFIDALRDGCAGFCGGNVTIPHKQAVMDLVDRPDSIAVELGAANTLWVEEGLVHATNTDGYGFLANLDERSPGWAADGKREVAVVLGAGGASRAVVRALLDRGFSGIRLVNRTVGRAEEIARQFGDRVAACPLDGMSSALSGASVFVNTSSLGMNGAPVPTIAFGELAEGAIVTDIVYAPIDTPFLRQARRAGFPTVDGLGMLLHQAVPGFEKWFGVRPAVTEGLRAEIVADLEKFA